MTTGAALSPSRTQVLERSLAMLFVLGDTGRPLPAPELAHRTGLPASTTYRLAGELEAHGLIERDDDGGLILGLRLLELARGVEDRLLATLLEPARHIMRALARDHGETALLTAPAGVHAIGLDAIEAKRPVQLSYARWGLAPMHLGASGKVLLAFLEPRAVAAALAAAQDGEGPAADVDRLEAELAEVRERGVAVSFGELDPGVGAVAAPVRSARGRLVAGLALAGPSERIAAHQGALAGAVREAALAVSAAMRPG